MPRHELLEYYVLLKLQELDQLFHFVNYVNNLFYMKIKNYKKRKKKNNNIF